MKGINKMKKSIAIFVTTATISNKTAEENLGLGYIAAACKEKDVDILLIDGWLEELSSTEIIEKIISVENPLFVGFSCNLLNGEVSIEIAKQLKKQNFLSPLISGGFAPSLNAKKYLNEGFDFVSVGEGEKTILDICDYLLYGMPPVNEISGLCYYNEKHEFCYNKFSIIENLDSLAFPLRNTFDIAMKNKIPINISTSRGCMAHCLFCSVAAFWRLGNGAKWRGRSITNIVDEIEILYRRGARYFKFVDDSFIEPPRGIKWCNDFANELDRRGIHMRFRVTMRADRVSKEVIEQLQRAGCDSIVVGIENYNDKALRRMGKKSDSKQNIVALNILKKFNVRVLHGFILFDYGTTMDELKDNYKRMVEYSWPVCKGIFSEMYAATGTLYTKLLENKNLLTSEAHYENYSYEIIDYKVKLVYFALKQWHINNARMYDMMIEPLNKPRVLSEKGLSEFYNIYLEIRKKDLVFMGEVLRIVDCDLSNDYLVNFVQHEIEKSIGFLEEYSNKVIKLYKEEKIEFLAEDDPFTFV